ncbi:MAG: glycine--tRNA ligase subunit alpha, partial [Acidobacteriota bacterium]
MTTETTLQGVIDRLTGFWHQQGCAMLPPCSFEVPLGLLHPEAFFRLLDPGPWRAAFVQPISRPADARGGTHPYRVARHLQLQVVWKDIDPRTARVD